MINKDFTQPTEAFELKQLGFDEPCFKFYIETGELIPASYSKEGTIYPSNSDLLPEWTASPTYSQAFRWFREKYGLSGWINESFIGDSRQGVISIKSEIGLKYYQTTTKLFDTYEEAELECLKELIKIVKGGNK
jgi:hypothetical protein